MIGFIEGTTATEGVLEMPGRITSLEVPQGWEDDRLTRTFEDVKNLFEDVDEEIGKLRIGLRFESGGINQSEAAAFVCDDLPVELTQAWWTSDADVGGSADPRQRFIIRTRNSEGGNATKIGEFDSQNASVVAYVRVEFPANKESRELATGDCLTFEVQDESNEGTPPNVQGLLELYFRRLDN